LPHQWLALILFVSVFFGYTNDKNAEVYRKQKTELVCSIKTKPDQHTVAFKKCISTASAATFDEDIAQQNFAFITYNRIIKVRLNTLSKQYFSFTRQAGFLPIKNIPNNSGKDIFISIG
jgi:hypothetical protein